MGRMEFAMKRALVRGSTRSERVAKALRDAGLARYERQWGQRRMRGKVYVWFSLARTENGEALAQRYSNEGVK